jgi:hypothetical protein
MFTGLAMAGLIAAGLLASNSPASAKLRLGGGDVLPFYARIEHNEVFHDGEWAVVVFYRPPSCVPADFNLLDQFDVPGAFQCGPATVGGFTLWDNGPGIDPAPSQVRLDGHDVPVWFVLWSELQVGISDGVLTLGELQAMPSLLVGSAGFYSETIHPFQATTKGMVVLTASGSLDDGGNFFVHAILNFASGRAPEVQIQFR